MITCWAATITLRSIGKPTTGLPAFFPTLPSRRSARIGQRYRSKYIAEVRGVWIDNSLAAIESERISDLQLGYSFETGSLKGLSVLLQVNNLTNTPYRTSLQDDSSQATPMRMMPERYNEYGRRVLLGVNYKL